MYFQENRRQKDFDYTKDKEDNGKTPLSRRMKGREFSKNLFQTMHEMKREISGMRRERHADPSRIFLYE